MSLRWSEGAVAAVSVNSNTALFPSSASKVQFSAERVYKTDLNFRQPDCTPVRQILHIMRNMLHVFHVKDPFWHYPLLIKIFTNLKFYHVEMIFCDFT